MAEAKVKLRPFHAPNFVSEELPPGLRQDGLKQGRQFALHELDESTLIELCDEFKANILEKARRHPQIEE